MISIIIPIYNSELYLEECLSSIYKQTIHDFEVICVNDGSIDNSLDICKSWGGRDPRFKVFSQDNSGVSAARNKGLDLAKGDYVCFVDSDDIIHELFLEKLIGHAGQNDLVICDWTRGDYFGVDGKAKLYTVRESVDAIVYEKIKHPNIPCFLFRKDIIDANNIRFDLGCVKNEDYEFYMKYLAVCKRGVMILDYVGYYYRENSSSAMHTPMNLKSLSSVEASRRIDETLYNTGAFDKKGLVLANGVLTYVYFTTRYKKWDFYEYLH